MKAIIAAGAALTVLSLAAADACAVWMTNGTPVCTADGDQFRPMIIPDGGQGAFMSWLDRRSGDWDIYVQHFNENGEPLWTINGVAVCTAPGDQGRAELVRDDSGGIIVAWFDGRGADNDIYAQRIDANGHPLWATGGIVLCSASGDQLEPRVVTDGEGGAIVSWEDHRGTGGIYAQRVDADGTVLWEADGVAISDAGGVSSWPSLVPDGGGGAIIAWFDSRTGHNDMYAQRVDTNGSTLWAVDGVTVCGAAGDQTSDSNLFIIPDGAGGGIITWTDGRAGGGDIYAQRIDADGHLLWTADGVALCTSAGDQMGPGITSDGAGGAIVAWQDRRAYDYDIYAQRVDSSGTVRWTPDGVALCVYICDQTGTKVTTDGSGGAVVTWRDARINDGTTDIFAQRIDAGGLVRWSDQGEPVCFTWYTQALGFIAPDELGGAIVVWHDYRNQSHYDIFAYRINPDPTFEGEPRPLILAVDDVPNDQGGKLSILWENSGLDVYPSLELESYSVWRRLPKPVLGFDLSSTDSTCSYGPRDDADAPVRMLQLDGYAWEWVGEVPAAFHDAYAMTAPSLYDSVGDDPGWQYFMVRAQTDNRLEFYDSPVDSGYSVDNLGPCPPQGVAAEQVPGPDNLLITWFPNMEVDLRGYRVYRGNSPGFVPDETALIVETEDLRASDGEWSPGSGYYYKVSALDAHGNESACVLVSPQDIVATQLQSFSAAVAGPGIEVTWRFAVLEPGAVFFILRWNGNERVFSELAEPSITREGFSFTFRDPDCLPGILYRYRVDISDGEGRRILFETGGIALPSIPVALYQNNPNPFNPSTAIRFYLDRPGTAAVEIYDISGRMIRRLVEGHREAGYHRVEWDGADSGGMPVSSGIYLCRLRAGKQVLTRKMVLLK